MNSPSANNLMDRMIIFLVMVILGIDFLRMLRHEMKMDAPIMKMNQGKTKSATVNPEKKKRNFAELKVWQAPEKTKSEFEAP